jgi:hypothetical protein
MTPTQTMPDLSPEVLAFAKEKGVTAYIPSLWELVRAIYPGRNVRVVLDVDPELCDVRTIMFEVDVGDMEVDQMIATHDAWTYGLMERCPTTHMHAFGLDMVHES